MKIIFAKNCGRIENAKKGTEYSSYITEKLPIQVVEYTAPETEKIIFECNNTRYWNSIGYLFERNKFIAMKCLWMNLKNIIQEIAII